jgi:hypothetical protein
MKKMQRTGAIRDPQKAQTAMSQLTRRSAHRPDYAGTHR